MTNIAKNNTEQVVRLIYCFDKYFRCYISVPVSGVTYYRLVACPFVQFGTICFIINHDIY